jgi:hypothetical protein
MRAAISFCQQVIMNIMSMNDYLWRGLQKILNPRAKASRVSKAVSRPAWGWLTTGRK